MSHVWIILQPFQWERLLRQYFSRLYSPSDIFFAPKCNVSHQLQLHNFYHTGQFISPSLQLLLCTSTPELIFLPLSHTSKFLSTLIPLLALSETTGRVEPIVRELNCPIKHFSKQKRIFPAFCSFCASFTFSIWCLPTFQQWLFFWCTSAVRDELLNGIFKLQNITRADYHKK